ncbi:MAG: N-acetylmuramoyl-L-alanine amidase [Thermoleophilaceae bacterium]
MRRVLILLAVAVAAILVVAAPALSLKPYRPEPVDFSMAADDVLGDPDPGEGVVSEPLRAPGRFNLVGLTWEADSDDGHEHGPAIAMRTRLDDGEWTDWAAVRPQDEDGPDPQLDEPSADGMSNPVWAGEADWVQYRSSEPLHGAEARFVNTAGTATAGDRVETALRGAVSTAVATVAGVLSADLAGAQEAQPEIVPRADWGAKDCRPRTAPAYGEVKAAYVHHTVNINDYSRSEAPQVVLGICRYHRNSNGWNDIGYNFLVDRFGTIYEGRAGGIEAAVIGAQAEGFNAQTTGIANIGTFSDVPQSPEAIEAMAALLRWKLPLHGYPTNGRPILTSAGGSTNKYASGTRVRVRRIIGHRDTNSTACPGNSLYDQLGDLRALAAGAQPVAAATTLSAETTVPRGLLDFGDEAPLSGTLATTDGTPVSGHPVVVQALIRGRWRTSSEPVTAADGTFAATVKPRVTREIRVRFAGSDELGSSVGPPIALRVRPVVRLAPLPPSVAPGERVRLRGRVRPRMRWVHRVVRVRRGARFRRVDIERLRPGRRGFFRDRLTLDEESVYRVYVVAKANRVRVRGTSQRIDVAVGSAALSEPAEPAAARSKQR